MWIRSSLDSLRAGPQEKEQRTQLGSRIGQTRA